MKKIIILGNGIAGITAARHIRKLSNDEITVISGESEHFFSRTALMYIYMGHMNYSHTKPYEDSFWKKNRIQLVKDWINNVDPENKVVAGESRMYSYDILVLATGSKPNKFGWPGQDIRGVQGLYSLQDLEAMELHTKGIAKAVVVGGGLIGIEMAEMLHSRGIHVTYLVREKNFWDIVLPEAEALMIERHIKEYHIDLRMESELKEIKGNSEGHVESIVTNSGEVINCQFVGLTVGVSPNISLFKTSGIKTNRGILVNEYLQTNYPDIYAIGDCAEIEQPLAHRRAIEAVWYVGRMMGETVAKSITGRPTAYQPGIWFNSAKFFDIEYQTYGNVPSKIGEHFDSLFWKNEKEKKAVRIVYKKEDHTVTGVNTLGIRMRHEVWDRWIKEEKKLHYVINNLPKANFDPEFFSRYEAEIQSQYLKTFPEQNLPLSKPTFFQRIFS